MVLGSQQMGPDGAQGRSISAAARPMPTSWLPQVKGVPIVGGVGPDGRGHRPPDDGDPGRLRGLEQARADGRAQSLVRAGGRRQSAARGVRPRGRAQLHHAGQGAAAELRAVLLARRRRAAILSALSRQLAARGLRPAGHADPDHAARKGQSVRRTSASGRRERSRRPPQAPTRRRVRAARRPSSSSPSCSTCSRSA